MADAKKHSLDKKAAKRRDAELAKIAKDMLRIDTLEERGSDGLDFHDIGVASLREALKAAYKAGRVAAIDGLVDAQVL